MSCYFDHLLKQSCSTLLIIFIVTFRMRDRRGEMYIGHGLLCICMSVYPSLHSHTTARTRM